MLWGKKNNENDKTKNMFSNDFLPRIFKEIKLVCH